MVSDPLLFPDVVGLVPAAGEATRMGDLPCSKEVLPLGYERTEGGVPRAVTGLGRLLRSFAASGIRRGLVVLRPGKWDIPERIRNGGDFGVDVVYRVLTETGSVVETLVGAGSFLQGHRVALGFPDIVYAPADSFAALCRRQEETDAAVVLGLFPCREPERSDMVELDERGRVRAVHVKGPDRGLDWAWGQAVWDRRFTELLRTASGAGGERELYPGDVVQRALEEGFPVDSVRFPEGVFLDAGTPEGMKRAAAWLESGGEPET